MKVRHYLDVTQQPVTMEGSAGCRVRWLLAEPDGAPSFSMRQFEVAPGGHTPRHHHPYEHEVFVLEGSGIVAHGDIEHPLKPGDVVLVSPDDVHQFRNTGDTPLKFLCLVPNSAAQGKVQVVPECGVQKNE